MSMAKPKHEPAVAEVYKHSRNEERLQILYLDDEVVLLRTENGGRGEEKGHRLERRVAFEDGIDSGLFKHQPDSDLDMIEFEERDWSEVNHIGEKTASNLHDEGYETNLDIQQADDATLLTTVDGLGAKGLDNLRNFAR